METEVKGSEKRRQETQSRIVDAALELFSKSGFHNTQVMDIVNEVGMSAGTFYNYFNDKKALFLYITKANIETLRRQLKSLRQPENVTDFKKRINQFNDTFTAFFNYVDNNQSQFLMILRNGFGVDEDIDDLTWELFKIFAEDISADFKKWQDLGFIEGVNLKIFGLTVLGMSLQVAHGYLIEKEFSIQEAIDAMKKAAYALLMVYLTDKGKKILFGGDDF